MSGAMPGAISGGSGGGREMQWEWLLQLQLQLWHATCIIYWNWATSTPPPGWLPSGLIARQDVRELVYIFASIKFQLSDTWQFTCATAASCYYWLSQVLKQILITRLQNF